MKTEYVKKKWRIGTEHEKFGFIKQDLKPIVYEDINKIFQIKKINFLL